MSDAVKLVEERDITVTMRDGTKLAIDVYRPAAPGKYPVLYASALHNKDIQGPDIADVLPPQPAHAPLWFGPIEAGDTRRFIANGYVHVISQPRGSAKSEGHYGHVVASMPVCRRGVLMRDFGMAERYFAMISIKRGRTAAARYRARSSFDRGR